MNDAPRTLLAIAATMLLPAQETEADWLAFRGDGASIARGSSPPTDWSIETGTNVAWQADLPGRGVSGPIVAGGRVFVTASDGPDRERLHVVALDDLTGREVWRRRMWATGRPYCHPTSANAAPTPASDGERVFVFYSSNDLAAFGLDGDLQWVRALALDHPRVGNDVGMASSPVVVGEAVVVQAECEANSFAIAVDRRTGETLWEVARPPKSNWSSPLPWTTADGRAAVWLQSELGAALHDAATGERLAQIETECATIASPAAADDGSLVLPAGGVSVFGSPFAAENEPLLRATQLQPGSPTPIVWEGQVLVINRGGVLTSGDLATGETLWRRRLGGRFWATPLVADGRLYSVNAEGKATVVDLRDRGRVLAKPEFGEDVLGSPAASGDALYFRSHARLWKIAAPSQAALATRRR